MMKILKSIGIFLLVLMLCSGMMLLGGLTCAGLPNAALWMYICAIAMVILLVGGGLLSLLWLKKIQKMKVRDIMDLRDDLIARMAENRAAETRKFHMAQILSFAYVIVLVVLALALFFFMGSAGVCAVWRWNPCDSQACLSGFFQGIAGKGFPFAVPDRPGCGRRFGAGQANSYIPYGQRIG